jgi:hypothetical protein
VIEQTPPYAESVAVAPPSLLVAGFVIGALALIASRIVSFYNPDSLDEQLAAGEDPGEDGRK